MKEYRYNPKTTHKILIANNFFKVGDKYILTSSLHKYKKKMVVQLKITINKIPNNYERDVQIELIDMNTGDIYFPFYNNTIRNIVAEKVNSKANKILTQLEKEGILY